MWTFSGTVRFLGVQSELGEQEDTLQYTLIHLTQVDRTMLPTQHLVSL